MNPDLDVLTNLDQISKSLFDEINNCARYCASYRSCEQRPGHPLVCAPQWLGTQRVWETRDALNYRAASLRWHVDLLIKQESEQAQFIVDAGFSPNMDPNAVHHALSILGFVFDDLLFNAASLFDYLAKFISSVGYVDGNSKQNEWKGLASKRQRDLLEHAGLAAIIEETDRIWVTPLMSLRSQVIHNKPDVGDMSCKTVRGESEIQHNVHFYMPEGAIKKLQAFVGTEKYSLAYGAAALALQSLVFTKEILQQMQTFEYECIHYPARDAQRKLQATKSNKENI